MIKVEFLEDEGEICLHLNREMYTNFITKFEMFAAWKEQAEKFKNGKISKEEYDYWRYNYPKQDKNSKYAKVASKEISDTIM